MKNLPLCARLTLSLLPVILLLVTQPVARGQAQITSPPPGSVLTGSSMPFTWSSFTGATKYTITARSGPGGTGTLFDSQVTINSSTTSATMINLPVNGIAVFIRLITSFSGGSVSTSEVSYTAATIPPAELTDPSPGSVLPGPSAVFSWKPVPQASKYELRLGKSLNSIDYGLFDVTSASTSVTVTNKLPTDGSTVRARLVTFFGTNSYFNDYTYLAFGAAGSTLAIQQTALATGIVGQAYQQTLSATGGTAPYSNWTVSAGALPPGLTLNAATGVISGTPTTAAGSPFNFSVTVKDSAGSVAQAKAFSIAVSLPAISGISPNSATAGGPAFTLAVNGTGFVSGSTVQWNNTPLATTFVSGAQLTAAVPANLIAAAGTANVSVANSGGVASNSVVFTIGTTAGCSPTGLLIQGLNPQPGFAAAIGQPVNIQVAIADNCGSPVLSGRGSLVAATFSNNDPTVTLTGTGQGKFAGTWIPASAQPGVVIDVAAFEALPNGIILGGRVDIAGIIQTSSAASLVVTPGALTFSLSQGGQPASQPVTISNQGAQSASFSAATTTPWLSLSPNSGSAAGGAPGIVNVTANPANLAPGTYTGTVVFQSGGTLLTPLAVTLTVSAAQPILLLSQSGLSFTAAQGGGTPLPQDFGILNIGRGAMAWNAQASIVGSGPKWLSISPASGTVSQPYLDVSLVNVNVDPAGLSPGTYYGQIKITAPTAGNSPQSVSVVLTILPFGANPGPEVRPTGLIFAGPQGATPSAQQVMIANTAGSPNQVTSAPITFPGVATWFTYNPSNTTVVPGQPLPIKIQADFSRLSPGPTRGEIALLFQDGTSANIALLAVIPPAGSNSAEKGGAAAGGCNPTQINIQPSNPQPTTSLGQPVTVEAVVVDSCAQALTASTQGAAVRVGFSNGDPGGAMTHVGNGRWTATWQPQKLSPSGTYVATVTAFEALGNGNVVANQVDIPVSVSGSGNVPIVTSGKIFNAASFASTTPVAPGSLISIFGDQLVTGPPAQAGPPPLPAQLGGTQLLLGGVSLPLLYAASGQVNAQIPYGIPVNVPTQLIVQRTDAISIPQTVSVAPAQPAIFTRDQSGQGQGVIVNGVTNRLADSDAPVTAGDTIVIYCTGLGEVTPPVAPGVAATGQTPTVQPVTVTIGGQTATPFYAGLTPSFPGLYQVNVVVPNGVAPGNQVPVVVSTSGQTSPAVTIAIK